MVIWKFTISPNVLPIMPKGAKLLSVGVQMGDPVMWAMVDPDAETEHRQIAVVPTGHMHVPDNHAFVGTFQLPDGLVFHVFDRLD